MRLILTAQLVKKGPNVKFCFIETPQDLYQMTLDLFVFLCPNVSSEHDKWSGSLKWNGAFPIVITEAEVEFQITKTNMLKKI